MNKLDEALHCFNLGVSDLIEDSYDKSIINFTKSIKLFDKVDSYIISRQLDAYRNAYASVYTNRGNAYRMLKDYKQAISDYAESIIIYPNGTNGFISRANLYYELQEYEKSIVDFSRCIELFEKMDSDLLDKHLVSYINAYSNRGGAYFMLKDYDKSIIDYSKSLTIDPNDSVAYNNRGSVYKELGEADKAEQDFKKAHELGLEYNKN